jgi:hypothetical protein
MEADLEISPLGPDESQLRLSGSYDPPLGSIGRQLDRLLLHQLAEATVRAFLSQLVTALLDQPEPGVPRSALKMTPHDPESHDLAADVDASAREIEEPAVQGSQTSSLS